jgi:hypothetical protein
MGLCLPPSLSEETRQGCKSFRLLGPLFDHLPLAATERDRAGNRPLFYDPYASLLWRYFFTPVVTSWRGLPQTTTLATDDDPGHSAGAPRHPPHVLECPE